MGCGPGRKGKLPHTWLGVTAHIEQSVFPGGRHFRTVLTPPPALRRTTKGIWILPVCLSQHMTVKDELTSNLNDQKNKHVWERFVQLILKVKYYLYCAVIVHWGISFQAVNNGLYYHGIIHFQEICVLQNKGRYISPAIKILSENKLEKLHEVSCALNPDV